MEVDAPIGERRISLFPLSPLREKARMRGIKKVIAVSMTPPHPGPLPGRERVIKRSGVS
jgi:hypothetical protein